MSTQPPYDLTKAHQCLSFFASVIKSGEPFTEHCQKALDEARAELNKVDDRDLTELAELTSVLRISVFDEHHPSHVLTKELQVGMSCRYADIPQTMGDQVWLAFQFRSAKDKEIWEYSLPQGVAKKLAPDLIRDVIKNYASFFKDHFPEDKTGALDYPVFSPSRPIIGPLRFFRRPELGSRERSGMWVFDQTGRGDFYHGDIDRMEGARYTIEQLEKGVHGAIEINQSMAYTNLYNWSKGYSHLQQTIAAAIAKPATESEAEAPTTVTASDWQTRVADALGLVDPYRTPDAILQHLRMIKGWEDDVIKQTDRADKAEAERDHWKANHDNQVALKATLLDRPDLGDRAERMEALISERDQAIAERKTAFEFLAEAQRERDAFRNIVGLVHSFIPKVAEPVEPTFVMPTIVLPNCCRFHNSQIIDAHEPVNAPPLWKAGLPFLYGCTICGNKRCPHAANCENGCTNSNEPGQPGSDYPKV